MTNYLINFWELYEKHFITMPLNAFIYFLVWQIIVIVIGSILLSIHPFLGKLVMIVLSILGGGYGAYITYKKAPNNFKSYETPRFLIIIHFGLFLTTGILLLILGNITLLIIEFFINIFLLFEYIFKQVYTVVSNFTQEDWSCTFVILILLFLFSGIGSGPLSLVTFISAKKSFKNKK
ncbi:hypothetical protein GPZ88_10100 (plasmid) [Streptococcus ruminicola]|uniref:Uncharacterized protein n=1 Tax=Streptococcus ruminicola TaxID=2686210 RepID=A0A6G8I2Y2_9STRE|nr:MULTISPECIES: hypothetical protein [Streptococcus]QGX47370.1 hypothetical protein GPA00_09555 [Streptococcus equinus]QIM47418.1 hypothetical protein GPZ88_10100 [Streptococcus ruminicola]